MWTLVNIHRWTQQAGVTLVAWVHAMWVHASGPCATVPGETKSSLWEAVAAEMSAKEGLQYWWKG